jgi:stage II sporulation protein P
LSSPIRRRQRKPDGFYIGLIAVIVIFLLSGFAYLLWDKAVSPVAMPTVARAQPAGETTGSLWWPPQWKEVLGQGVPGLFTVMQPPSVVKVTPEFSVGQVFRRAVMAITGVDVKDMRSLLQGEIPLLLSVKGSGTTVSAMSLPDFPKFDFKIFSGSGNPLVGIYHTHTAESFIPTSGQSHSPGGQRGDIVKVGDDLAKYLEKKGVGTVHSDNIHDYPSFMKAYNLSELTVKKMLSDNPSLQMIFDIHRDAEKRENVTAMVNGVAVARILIVVAVGQPDLVQPHWQQNHAFAKLIEGKLNERYPGLSRGIQMVDWRYNQHLHPRALLLEVGCQENSLEEANRSIEMLGEVLVDIINENKES